MIPNVVGDDCLVTSDEKTPFEFVMVPDSADTRLFVELSSYGTDLHEAQHALDLASQAAEGSPLHDAEAYLIGFAAVAYCRTFFASNVRKRLTDHIVIPDELQKIHLLIGAFRNTTIAHSQSELATTFPVGVLDSGTLRVRDVTAASYTQTLPPPVVVRFRELLNVVDELLYDEIEPVRKRLTEQLRRADLVALLAGDSRPDIIDATAVDFDPKTKRLPYPTGNTVYWSVEGVEWPDSGA